MTVDGIPHYPGHPGPFMRSQTGFEIEILESRCIDKLGDVITPTIVRTHSQSHMTPYCNSYTMHIPSSPF
jgi:hypothetical protein